MKKFVLLFVIAFVPVFFAQNAWINEFHYDNYLTDAGEFLEVIIQNPGDYTLSDFLITLYNGNGGASYGTHDLSTFTVGDIDPLDNSFRYYSKLIAGIQNGSPDGLCLSHLGTVIQFLSYEGSFTAIDGVANGMMSTDIGIAQDGTEAVGSSLGLTGTGTQYSDFTWTAFTDDSPGSPNGLQYLPVEFTSFSASVISSTVKLSWRTASEINNYGFEIERSVISNEERNLSWEKIGFVDGAGSSITPKDYTYTDASVVSGKYSYRLKQIDNNGTSSYSKTVEVDLGAPKKYELAQNFPNPFNPNTAIKFTLPETGNVKLTVYNMLGQEIATLVNGVKEAGTHIINFDAEGLNSGVYVYRIESNGFNEVRKMTLIK